MKPLPPETYLTRPLSELIGLPASTPMAHQLQHAAWVLAFTQALALGDSLGRHMKGMPGMPGEVEDRLVNTIHVVDLMSVYDHQVAQPLGRTAPVEALIQHLDRLATDPSLTWSLTDTGVYRDLVHSPHTYRDQALALPVIQHWLTRGPTEPLARILFEDQDFDPERGEIVTLANAFRTALNTGEIERVRRAWDFLDVYAKPQLLVTWAQQGLSSALDEIWPNEATRLQGWSEGFAYAIFNEVSPRAVGELWSRLEREGQPEMLDALNRWLYGYAMDADEEEEQDIELDTKRVRTLIQQIEPLRGVVPVEFWQGVPSVRAQIRQTGLAQRPAVPARRSRSRT